MKNYYDELGVTPQASLAEIQQAFRREIARYHPDKVEHLGPELVEVAASRATAITMAYNVLRDTQQRADYDAQLGTQTAPTPSVAPASDPVGTPVDVPQAATETFLRRATLQRLRRAVDEEWEGARDILARGFDLAVILPGRRGLFQRAAPSVALLARMVDTVDAGSVEELWPDAGRAGIDQGATAFVLLVGASLQPRQEIADAIARARRRWPAWAGVVLAPVSARDWKALVPADAPPPARRLLDRLATG